MSVEACLIWGTFYPSSRCGEEPCRPWSALPVYLTALSPSFLTCKIWFLKPTSWCPLGSRRVEGTKSSVNSVHGWPPVPVSPQRLSFAPRPARLRLVHQHLCLLPSLILSAPKFLCWSGCFSEGAHGVDQAPGCLPHRGQGTPTQFLGTMRPWRLLSPLRGAVNVVFT